MVNWNADRAIGFVTGAFLMFGMVAAIATETPYGAIAGLVMLAVAVFAPRTT